MVIEIVQRSDPIHGVHMATILAVSSFLSRLKQVVKDVLYGFPMRRVCLVKGKHVDEDDVSLVHEEVAEQIKVVSFADLLRRLDPAQDLLAFGRNDGTVVVMRADTAPRLG